MITLPFNSFPAPGHSPRAGKTFSTTAGEISQESSNICSPPRLIYHYTSDALDIWLVVHVPCHSPPQSGRGFIFLKIPRKSEKYFSKNTYIFPSDCVYIIVELTSPTLNFLSFFIPGAQSVPLQRRGNVLPTERGRSQSPQQICIPASDICLYSRI